jgi:hypothetical protein
MLQKLANGGNLVTLHSGGSAVEQVPDAHKGMIVQSGHVHRDGKNYVQAQYRLTKRVARQSDLWHVRRVADLT